MSGGFIEQVKDWAKSLITGVTELWEVAPGVIVAREVNNTYIAFVDISMHKFRSPEKESYWGGFGVDVRRRPLVGALTANPRRSLKREIKIVLESLVRKDDDAKVVAYEEPIKIQDF